MSWPGEKQRHAMSARGIPTHPLSDYFPIKKDNVFYTPFQDTSVFIEQTAKLLKVPPPSIGVGLLNKRFERPIIRGLYDIQSNSITIANDYGFWKEEDIHKSIKHEIAEWLRYVVTKERVHRLMGLAHSDDKLHTALMRNLRTNYLNNPKGIAEFVNKRRGDT